MESTTAVPAVEFSSHGKNKANAHTLEISLKNIKVISGFNPRSGGISKEETQVLADSIAKNGLIHPLTVRPTKTKGEYELVSGHRRFAALQFLTRDKALCVVRTDLDENAEAKAFAVAENSQDGRTDLTYTELGRTFQWMTKEGWGVDKIAGKSGIHVATVRRALKLMELPQSVLELVNKRILSDTAALAYAKLDPKVQNKIPEDKLEGASAHYIRVLAAEAQKELDKAAGGTGTEGANATGKKKGKAKVNWRTPQERNELIIVLAHEAYNPKNDGAEAAYGQLEVMYWLRGHGKQPGDLTKDEMRTLIKADNDLYDKRKAAAEAKAAKEREAKAKKEEAQKKAK